MLWSLAGLPPPGVARGADRERAVTLLLRETLVHFFFRPWRYPIMNAGSFSASLPPFLWDGRTDIIFLLRFGIASFEMKYRGGVRITLSRHRQLTNRMRDFISGTL